VPDLAREEKQSGYIARKLDARDWTHILNGFLQKPERGRASSASNLMVAGSVKYRGRQRLPFHGKVDMNLFFDVFWMSEDQERKAASRFLDRFLREMAPYGNGETYQNYPRRAQLDYRRRY